MPRGHKVQSIHYAVFCNDPAFVHRVAVIGAGTLDSLPHNGAVVTLLAVCGSTHGKSYRDIVVVGIIGAILALIAVIVLGSFSARSDIFKRWRMAGSALVGKSTPFDWVMFLMESKLANQRLGRVTASR
ncbi:hypothetical protein D3C87_1580290 [compost metagenome]